ncbi:MAG: ATP12 chaperone family protein [Alphaproteobacteria bacterium]|nr:ATP12 chaperone family protein [Alphaproteobacteria bacterium]
MKRFYKTVSTKEAAGGYLILLDGKPVKTQSGKELNAKNQNLAEKIMLEWAEQKESINPDSMPLTQILNTEIDHVASERAKMQEAVLNYFNTDLLCYWASAPESLIEKQKALWQPQLDWFAKKFGHTLKTTTALKALIHSTDIHKILKQYVESLDHAHFTALQIATSVSGSIILGIITIEKAASPEQLVDVIYLEENFKSDLYNANKYGVDPMLEKAQAAVLRDLTAVQTYVSCLTPAK